MGNDKQIQNSPKKVKKAPDTKALALRHFNIPSQQEITPPAIVLQKSNIEETATILDETTGLFLAGTEIVPMEQSLNPPHSIDEDKEIVSIIAKEHDSLVNSTLINIKNLNFIEFLQRDQLNRINSLADAHLVCADGHVPFHRYILMAASQWINQLLIDEDPSELTVIHLPDIKVVNAVQVISAVYSGKTLYAKSDEKIICDIFQMLGINNGSLQLRNPATDNESSVSKLRFYQQDVKLEEDISPTNILESGDVGPEKLNVETNDEIEADLERICDERGLSDDELENRGPKVTSKSQIDKAETVKFKSIRVELSKSRVPDEDALNDISSASPLVNSTPSVLNATQENVVQRNKVTEDSIKLPQLPNKSKASENIKDGATPIANSRTRGRKRRRNGSKKKTNCKRRKTKNQKRSANENTEPDTENAEKVVENEATKNAKQKTKNGKKQPTTIKKSVASQITDPKTANTKNIVENEDHQNMEQNTQRKIPLIDLEPIDDSHDSVESVDSVADVIFLKEVIHHSKTCTSFRNSPSTSSASVEMMECGDENAVENLEEQEDIKYVTIANDPSGCYEDISNLSVENLHKLLTKCPVCRRNSIEMKGTARCLRYNHGLRRCWICLKLVPFNPHDFLSHNLQHIIPGTKGKVPCPFCHEQFDYQRGVNAHCSYHFSTLLATKPKVVAPKIPEKPKKTAATKKTPKKTSISSAGKKSSRNGQSIGNKRIPDKCKEPTEIVSSDSDDDGDDEDYTPSECEMSKRIFARKKPPRTRNYLLAEKIRNDTTLPVPIVTTTNNATACPSQNGISKWDLLNKEMDDMECNMSVGKPS